ncbi:DUF871 domain-containing protein [Streptococcus sp. S784/96/1]|uniref:DUF871 domain-containing protein n=1 Tax=Streptococcus sp. S784/96/1 TaxID=2653499 RepID=UPI001386B207|nr:MupG family TIM beta-alpha barrel fold protein [Streptococcus sp. S784/96/1]
MELGFSMYPEQYPLQTSFEYINMLADYGAKRLFLSLLQIDTDSSDCFQIYKDIVQYANSKGIRVVADISPRFIEAHRWRLNLMEMAHEFGLSGIRLDESLDISEITKLTHNKYGIKIELNASTEDKLLKELLSEGANKENLMGCHNFYPHRYTGLSREHFLKMSQIYHEHQIETSVFISSNTASEGPWPVSEGLPTLEELRDLPIELQVDILKCTGLFDNVIVSNQWIQETELKSLVDRLADENIIFKYHPYEPSDIETAILESQHRYRGDISDYVIRSTESRLAFVDADISPRNENAIEHTARGVLTIDNNHYLRYKGELQIVLKPYPKSPKVNIVGKIDDNYLILLDYIKPWQLFKLFPCS